MLDGVNDRPDHARELARLLRGHDAKVNLSPFNTFPGTKYRRSSAEAIRRFRELLVQGGVMATVRRTRGDDIEAACGQLRGQVLDRTQVRLGNKLVGIAVRA
jgi:23S rRNA (adenine2503-C2)-methyltransferase